MKKEYNEWENKQFNIKEEKEMKIIDSKTVKLKHLIVVENKIKKKD